MKLSQAALARPHRLEKTSEAEVENLRQGLSALGSEPELINEVALCLAYLSLGEHGRAGLALALVHEFQAEIDLAASRLSPPRRMALDSLLRRIETIAQIQATRNSLRTGMQFHTSHYLPRDAAAGDGAGLGR